MVPVWENLIRWGFSGVTHHGLVLRRFENCQLQYRNIDLVFGDTKPNSSLSSHCNQSQGKNKQEICVYYPLKEAIHGESLQDSTIIYYYVAPHSLETYHLEVHEVKLFLYGALYPANNLHSLLFGVMTEGPVWLSESQLYLLGWMLKDMFWSARSHFALCKAFALSSPPHSPPQPDSLALPSCGESLQCLLVILHDLYMKSLIFIHRQDSHCMSPPSVSLQLLFLPEPFYLPAQQTLALRSFKPRSLWENLKGQMKQALCLAVSRPRQFIYVNLWKCVLKVKTELSSESLNYFYSLNVGFVWVFGLLRIIGVFLKIDW